MLFLSILIALLLRSVQFARDYQVEVQRVTEGDGTGIVSIVAAFPTSDAHMWIYDRHVGAHPLGPAGVLTMSIDLKQNLDVIDYFGALVVWIIFFSILFIVSVTCINWCCIQKHDDITVLEEWGYNHRVHMRMGPHRPSVVARNVRHPPKSDNGF